MTLLEPRLEAIEDVTEGILGYQRSRCGTEEFVELFEWVSVMPPVSKRKAGGFAASAQAGR